ncbi:MAG: porin [Methylococcales bacterium]|nr:porin [Methylococcales bacterium]
MAEEPSAIKALTGKDFSQLSGLDSIGLTAGGWATAGFTYNPSQPKDRSNGSVQFNNRANEFHLYQLGLFVDKSLDRSSQNWQLGGRFEFMFGTDAPNTQATGHWDTDLINTDALRFYDVALPQAYFEILIPVRHGISAKIGHFYSIIGYESVPSPLNLFVSHSYSMKSSPFTMSGLLTSYQVNDLLTVQAGAVTGADNVDQHAGAWSFLGGINVTNQQRSRDFTFSILDGEIDDTQPSHLTYYYSMLHQAITEKLHVILQHDYGRQQNAKEGKNAEWYSLVNYLTYEITPHWNTGIRAEWFHDDDGTRFSTAPGSYYALSVASNWKPYAWLTLRPEIRHDWASGSRPFQNETRDQQLLLIIDAVIRF